MLTEDQIKLYFQKLREKKTTATQYKERLIDTFLNSAYLRSDGSMLLIFNYSGKNNTVTYKDVEHLLCSNSPPVGGPDATNTNTTLILIGLAVAVIVAE